MYSWIWRRLPGGPGRKALWATGLIATAVAVLWFWVFPAVEPHLRFDDGTVETVVTPGPGESPRGGGTASPAESPRRNG
jgi:hypothetical protein